MTDEKKICEICGANEAVERCQGCGKAMCRECRRMDIWGCGAEDLTPRYFCPACRENPQMNPWGAHDMNHVMAHKKVAA